MSGRSHDGTRLERTGWRDAAISSRHREWGFNCPAVDLDFLVAEYNIGKPVALVEYKHHGAKTPVYDHPTYRALADLADNYAPNPLPFIVAFYWPDVWAFRITPVNAVARSFFENGLLLTEREYVRVLYRLRRLTLSRELEAMLNNILPFNDEAA